MLAPEGPPPVAAGDGPHLYCWRRESPRRRLTSGAQARTRTGNLPLRRRALCPIELPGLGGGGGVIIDATGGWDQGWKVTHTQGGTTTDLQTSPAPTRITLTQGAGKVQIFIDRWGMLSETNGGAPAATMEFPIHPTGKTDTDSSAIRLCVTGGRIEQKKQGAAC